MEIQQQKTAKTKYIWRRSSSQWGQDYVLKNEQCAMQVNKKTN